MSKKIYSSYLSASSSRKNTNLQSHLKSLFAQFDYHFSKYLPKDLNASIVDIGCGAGEFLYWLNSKGYRNIIGYDISIEQVEKGKALYDVDIQHVNILEQDFDLKALDLIFMRDVLEHFDAEMLDLLLGRIESVIHLNPTVIIQTVNGNSKIFSSILYSDITHKSCFTERSVHQLFSSRFNCDLEFIPWYPVTDSRFFIFRKCIIQLVHFFERARVVIEVGHPNKIFTVNLLAVIKLNGGINEKIL